MLQRYTNNTNTVQHFIDVNGNPVVAAIGETVIYEDRNSKPSSIDGLDMIVESDGDGMPIYIGYAIPETAENQQGWAIKKRVVVGLVEKWPWVEAGFILRYRWDNRASLN